MKREDSVRALQAGTDWDVVVIGGGATGLGCAVDAAARGYRTALVEQGDFAQGTSSRSTKLVHGGLRYLREGNIALVRQALHERGLLLRNAPHLVEPLDFVIPTYAFWEAASYGMGLKFYDLLAGKLGLGGSRALSAGETMGRLPTLSSRQIRGGILYRDAQFDDARLAISLAQTFAGLGGTPMNYARVISLLHRNAVLCGVRVRDLESQDELEIPRAS
jgi:glycerol-3-phosphate dehydrogenase